MSLLERFFNPLWSDLARLSGPRREDAENILFAFAGIVSSTAQSMIEPALLGMRMTAAARGIMLAPSPIGGKENAEQLLAAETALAAISCSVPTPRSAGRLKTINYALVREYLGALVLCVIRNRDRDDKRMVLKDAGYRDGEAECQLQLSISWSRILGQPDPATLLVLMDRVGFTHQWQMTAETFVDTHIEGFRRFADKPMRAAAARNVCKALPGDIRSLLSQLFLKDQ